MAYSKTQPSLSELLSQMNKNASYYILGQFTIDLRKFIENMIFPTLAKFGPVRHRVDPITKLGRSVFWDASQEALTPYQPHREIFWRVLDYKNVSLKSKRASKSKNFYYVFWPIFVVV